MADPVYEALRELLDTHPVGCRHTPEIIRILEILFTPAEARAALGLGFVPFTVEQIAARAKMDPQEAAAHLTSLADKGLVFEREKKGGKGYALLNSIQIFENPYRKTVNHELTTKLRPLWKAHQAETFAGMDDKGTPLLRVIPIEKKIRAEAEVLPFESVYEMIEKSRIQGISPCPCRALERKCDAPREGCMHFDATSTFLVERGFGRYLSKDEMKRKLRQFDEMGLVRQVNNTGDRLEMICHCCSCCCAFLRNVKDYGSPRGFARSAFLPVTNVEICQGCGTCADKRCPTKAIEMIGGKPVLKLERCIGCGLCSTGCPNEAIVMERAADRPAPPANFMDLGLRMLQERGKLEKYIEIHQPGK
jgi:Na+-translocating ferredoxin:NAD+ oxidoreductase subunit B